MLRPATPLAVLLFLAFALLLMAVISTPIIKAIPLGEYVGVTFGVFGWCKGDRCSKIEIGYDDGLASVLAADDDATFDLPSDTRRTLSTILIIHPVAALITLIMFAMSIAAHFHAASHSARYLLIVFIIGILNFVVCLLAFLIDVLLFVPHMAWGSYLVLAATILVALSGLVSCAMRRTLVSRKARKKRIEENAEMSGENFYNRQAQQGSTVTAESKQPTVPVISGANGGGGGDKLPTFATFDKKDDRSSDERVPLTSQSPSNRSPNTPANDPMGPGDVPGYGMTPPRPSRSPSVQQRDQYGNPIEPVDAYGMRRGPSRERMRGRGGGGPPGGFRGRGGYGPPGRGGPGYGYGPQGRGGYGPPGRGGYGPPGGRGGYGPPPRGYGPPMRGRPTPPPPGYQYDRRGSPANAYGGPYGADPRQPSPGPGGAAAGYGMNNQSRASLDAVYNAYSSDRDDLPRAESPPPLPGVDDTRPGLAVEMNAATGSPQHAPKGFGQFRDSDADIAGMVGLQQGISPVPAEQQRHETYMSDPSRYSQDEQQYVPARAAWNNSPSVPSPLNVQSRANNSATELSGTGTSRSPPPSQPQQQGPRGGREVSSQYYEDIDPRFAEPSPRRTSPPPIQTGGVAGPAGDYQDTLSPLNNDANGSGLVPPRSPAESERSTFTSISQRGINPRWNPPPPALMPGYSQPPPRRPNPSDMLLNNNPDFELPGAASAKAGPARGMGAGGAYPTGPL